MRLPLCIVASAVWLSSSVAWAQTADSVPTPRAETVRLHVEGPGGTEVLGRSTPRGEWTPVCRAPCDEEVSRDWEYRVTGGGMKSSRAFDVKAAPGPSVVVHVDPASKGWFIAGVVGMGTGGAGAVVSLLVWLFAGIQCGGFGTHDAACQNEQDTRFHVMEAVSGALFVGGAVALFTNLSTTVSQDEERSDAMPSGEQVWRTAGRREALPFPAATGAPLVTLRF